MKTALKTKPSTRWRDSLAPNRLVAIKFQDYTFLALRDHATENFIALYFHKFFESPENFKPPKLYTLVSQNRKISLDKNLSSSDRLFLNFESHKWSELYFVFLRKITFCKTNQFIFENVLYKLDLHKAFFYFSILQITCGKNQSALEDPVERLQMQRRLMSMIDTYEYSDSVFIFFIYELLMIAIDQPCFSWCSRFINSVDAQHLLNFFSAKGLIRLKGDQLQYEPEFLRTALKGYLLYSGRFLLTHMSQNLFNSKVIERYQELFNQHLKKLKTRQFETCFQHM